MAGVLAGVWACTPQRGIGFFGPDEFYAGYRRFSLAGVEGFFMIARVLLDLEVSTPEAVRAEGLAALGRKKATQPIAAATAGCVFKNPEGQSAGRLLDLAGFRGRRCGGMEFSAMHANFLVNRGGGASREALELIEAARQAVLAGFGTELELEVRVAS
jgi:UDP-N-acetylmuramate dehydrogenase